MITGRNRFNLYLPLLAAALAVAGCRTSSDTESANRKLASTLGIHVEVPQDSMDFSMRVTVIRDTPIVVNVDKSPFVTEANVTDAKVMDAPGGFVLQIQFDRRGTWLLEEYTTSNPGKHFAIFSRFGEKLDQNRWLAAPKIPRRISNGVLTFTPDATREEAEQMIAAAERASRILTVGHIERFNPAVLDLRRRLANGELGRIFELRASRPGPFPARIRDVGVVVDLAPHDLDVMRFLMGSDPVRLYAETEQRIHTRLA